MIGRRGGLPWRLPADLARFKRLTMGHHLILGRKTWESIGRALPGRRMVVVSRGAPALPPEVARTGSLEEALELARLAGDDEAFVGGGAEIYRLALPLADRLYLTRVEAEVEGDVTFPRLDEETWRRTAEEAHPADGRNPYPYAFEVWEKAG